MTAYGYRDWLPAGPSGPLTCTGTMINSWLHATAGLSKRVQAAPGALPSPVPRLRLSPGVPRRSQAFRLPSLAPSPLQGGPPHAR